MGRLIVPDYRRPRALLVPHYHSTIGGLLEAIATHAARHVGVILLSQDARRSEDFVAAQDDPERFRIVTAPYDTPWLRDRSPVAVRVAGDIAWVLPKLNTADRPLDEALFPRLVSRPVAMTLIGLPRGNLVAGPRGRAVVMTKHGEDVGRLRDRLVEIAGPLGVRRWIIAPSFARELTGHADVHVRFLNARLAAVAWNETDADDRARTDQLVASVRDALPGIDILKLPLRSDDQRYASPVNWLQFGKHLLVPRYDLTPDEDVMRIRAALAGVGYRCKFIHSPTLEYAGSLHCLTAALYV